MIVASRLSTVRSVSGMCADAPQGLVANGDRAKFGMAMTLRQIATKTALVVETILIILVATAVIPLCLAGLGVANRIVKQ
jgi:hypothetical protein